MGSNPAMPEPIQRVYWGCTITHPTQAQIDDSRARFNEYDRRYQSDGEVAK